jgi:uncharacterized membrane protein YdbT with pleckstrin-like domain
VPYPARLLHEGEDVHLDTRPHWSILFLPALETAVVLGAEGAGFVLWSSAPVWFGWVLFAIGVVVVGRFLIRLLAWRATELVVTSMRVIYRRGVFNRRGVEIPISSVQDVSYSQSLLARMLRRGTLEVDSAGSRGAERIVDVPRPAQAQSLINEAIEGLRQQGAAPVSDGQTETVARQIEHLSGLHDRGIITDDEFSRMKQELIGK